MVYKVNLYLLLREKYPLFFILLLFGNIHNKNKIIFIHAFILFSIHFHIDIIPKREYSITKQKF